MKSIKTQTDVRLVEAYILTKIEKHDYQGNPDPLKQAILNQPLYVYENRRKFFLVLSIIIQIIIPFFCYWASWSLTLKGSDCVSFTAIMWLTFGGLALLLSVIMSFHFGPSELVLRWKRDCLNFEQKFNTTAPDECTFDVLSEIADDELMKKAGEVQHYEKGNDTRNKFMHQVTRDQFKEMYHAASSLGLHIREVKDYFMV